LEDFHECASEHTQASFGILKECGMFAGTFFFTRSLLEVVNWVLFILKELKLWEADFYICHDTA
jgi:hypothetical protein